MSKVNKKDKAIEAEDVKHTQPIVVEALDPVAVTFGTIGSRSFRFKITDVNGKSHIFRTDLQGYLAIDEQDNFVKTHSLTTD